VEKNLQITDLGTELGEEGLLCVALAEKGGPQARYAQRQRWLGHAIRYYSSHAKRVVRGIRFYRWPGADQTKNTWRTNEYTYHYLVGEELQRGRSENTDRRLKKKMAREKEWSVRTPTIG
jgi:hypothetical protein